MLWGGCAPRGAGGAHLGAAPSMLTASEVWSWQGRKASPPPGCPAVMTCQEREDGRGAPGPDEMIQQRFHFISNLTLNFNSLKDKKPRDIRCNEIKQSFSDSKFDHKWALRLLL